MPGGTPAKVNQLIAVLTDDKDEDITAYLEKALKKSQDMIASKGGAKAAPAAAAPAAASNGAGPSTATYAPARATAAVATAPEPAHAAVSEGGRVKASPLARKMADEAGIALQNVPGSGPNGRIIRKDIENYKPATAVEPAAAKAGRCARRRQGGRGSCPASRFTDRSPPSRRPRTFRST